MTFEEFEKIVNEVATKGLDSYASRWDDQDGFFIDNGKVIQKHITGGAEGGNCWGDEARRFHNYNSVQPFLPLDNILKAVNPEISYLKYKEIESLIVSDEENEYEYYGNHTNYDIFVLDIRKLYDTLFPTEG